MARVLRGEVYWADLNPVRGREQAGLRPVLILSHDLFNRKSETVIAMAITGQPQKAGFPLTLALPREMLPKPSWVKISQIRTISVESVFGTVWTWMIRAFARWQAADDRSSWLPSQ